MRFFVLSIVTLSLLAACGNEESAPPSGGDLLAESYWADSAPAEAISVIAVHDQAESKDAIWVTGRVGEYPSGRAQFRLTDATYDACSDNEDDGCTTPWDYCCYSPDDLSRGTVIVEFRDAGGALQKASLTGFHGFDHLAHVAVRGRPEKDGAGNVILVAEALHVK